MSRSNQSSLQYVGIQIKYQLYKSHRTGSFFLFLYAYKSKRKDHQSLFREENQSTPSMELFERLLQIAAIVLFSQFLSSKFLVSAGKQHGFQSLRPGDSLAVESDRDFLVSPDGTFSAGFYKVGTNAYCYATWFSNSADKTVAWMANRDRPVYGQASKLYFRADGDLVLIDGDGTTAWETQTFSQGAAKVQLLETGNLVVINGTGGIIWESFATPTDTLLPYQKLTISNMLVSMKGPNTYLSGYYTFRFTDNNILSKIYNGPDTSSVYWPDPNISPFKLGRTPYNSNRSAFIDNVGFFNSSDFLSFKASDYGYGPKRRLTIGYDGLLRLYSLDDSSGLWHITWLPDLHACKVHGLCGPNGICAYEPNPTCTCPPGFSMTDPSDWFKGCSPQFKPACNDSDFLRLFHTDFWGYDLSSFGTNMSLDACKKACLDDCQCKGFAYQYSGQGICFPKSILLNGYHMPDYPNVMHIKVPNATNLGGGDSIKLSSASLNCSHNDIVLPTHGKEQRHRSSYLTFLVAFVASVGFVELICISFGWWYTNRLNTMEKNMDMGYLALAVGFKRFTYKELKTATGNFKQEIGKGGFGTVYRGTLDDNRQIAVKRLEGILQGEAEFWAEVSIIGKINHMNLVKMWGFCAEGTHRLLVYEYMENGSLDQILFSTSADQLDWEKRFDIALGTAKGLSYMHEECLQWILHCDIKPQNILLDRDLRAKVSDFGMAKLFDKRKDPQAEFSRVRGTRGYLAPEWMMNQEITSKADTYSYGIVLLELITGRSASGNPEYECNVLVQSIERKAGEEEGIEGVVDPRLNGEYDPKQLEKLLKVALLCVSYDKEKRPAMSEVVGLLLQVE